MDGQCALLINESDSNTLSYKRFPIERSIRALASKHSNSYSIAVFACLRDTSKKDYFSISMGRLKPEDEMTEQEKAERKAKEKDIQNFVQSNISTLSRPLLFGVHQRLLRPTPASTEPTQANHLLELDSEDPESSNLIILFGPKASPQATGENKVVISMIEAIEKSMNPRTLSADLPAAFNILKTKDPNFEMTITNTTQELKLYHKRSLHRPRYSNTATKTIGVIFVNTKSLELQYGTYRTSISGLLKSAHEFFAFLNVANVEVHTDLTKP